MGGARERVSIATLIKKKKIHLTHRNNPELRGDASSPPAFVRCHIQFTLISSNYDLRLTAGRCLCRASVQKRKGQCDEGELLSPV